MKLEKATKLSDLTLDQLISLRHLCIADFPGAKMAEHSMINSPAYSGRPAKKARHRGRQHLKRLNCTLKDVDAAISLAEPE